MTKVIILGEEPKKIENKKIEFVRWLPNDSQEFDSPTNLNYPDRWQNIELIKRGVHNQFDVMFAYDNGDRVNGCIFLGHFNDGIV